MPYATGYDVKVAMSDGRRSLTHVPRSRRSLVLATFTPGMTAKISVTAMSAQGTPGQSGNTQITRKVRTLKVKIRVKTGLTAHRR